MLFRSAHPYQYGDMLVTIDYDTVRSRYAVVVSREDINYGLRFCDDMQSLYYAFNSALDMCDMMQELIDLDAETQPSNAESDAFLAGWDSAAQAMGNPVAEYDNTEKHNPSFGSGLVAAARAYLGGSQR